MVCMQGMIIDISNQNNLCYSCIGISGNVTTSIVDDIYAMRLFVAPC